MDSEDQVVPSFSQETSPRASSTQMLKVVSLIKPMSEQTKTALTERQVLSIGKHMINCSLTTNLLERTKRLKLLQTGSVKETISIMVRT